MVFPVVAEVAKALPSWKGKTIIDAMNAFVPPEELQGLPSPLLWLSRFQMPSWEGLQSPGRCQAGDRRTANQLKSVWFYMHLKGLIFLPTSAVHKAHFRFYIRPRRDLCAVECLQRFFVALRKNISLSLLHIGRKVCPIENPFEWAHDL